MKVLSLHGSKWWLISRSVVLVASSPISYYLLGLTHARWNSEIADGKEEDFNLYLRDSPIEGTVRSMGELLNDLGGYRLMQDFVHFFTVIIPSEDETIDRQMTDWARMELNVAWNGIGQWQA